MLSEEAIEEFKKIWKEEFKEEISDQEAYEKGSRLVNLFRVLLKVDNKKNKEGNANQF